MICDACGTENPDIALFCKECGKPKTASAQGTTVPISAMASAQPGPMDSTVPIPDGVKGWSWGAFFLNWIWAIGNKTWIGLLALIPYVNIGIAIWLGIKGREMAWKNKPWDSLEHFNRVQKKWSMWGVICAVTFSVIALAVLGVMVYQQQSQKSDIEDPELRRQFEEALSAPVNIGEHTSPTPQEPSQPASHASTIEQNPIDTPLVQEAEPSFSPSFDCLKASTGPERLICSHRELAVLDVELMQVYQQLYSDYPSKTEKDSLRKEQNEWRTSKRDACATTDCIAQAYAERIEDLHLIRQYLSKPAEFR